MSFDDIDFLGDIRLIAVNGMSSSGKGTFAERAAAELPNAAVVYGDTVVWSSVLKRPDLQKQICGRTFSSFEEFLAYYLENESYELLLKLENNPYLAGDFEAEVLKAVEENPAAAGEARYIVVEWTLLNLIERIWKNARITVTLKTSPDVQRRIFLAHTKDRGDKLEALDIRNRKAQPLIRDGAYILQNEGDDSFFEEISRFCRAYGV